MLLYFNIFRRKIIFGISYRLSNFPYVLSKSPGICSRKDHLVREKTTFKLFHIISPTNYDSLCCLYMLVVTNCTQMPPLRPKETNEKTFHEAIKKVVFPRYMIRQVSSVQDRIKFRYFVGFQLNNSFSGHGLSFYCKF